MNKNLLILAGEIVANSQSNHPFVKIKALDWVQYEATETQIKAFLLDGNMSKLDEQEEEIVNDRFKCSKYYQQLLEGDLFLVMLAHLGTMAAYRTIRARFDEKLRRCGVYGAGFKHMVCMLVARREEAVRKIGVIKSAKSKCSQTLDSRACEMVLQRRIRKLETKLKKYDEKLVKARMKGRDVSGAISKYKEKKFQVF